MQEANALLVLPSNDLKNGKSFRKFREQHVGWQTHYHQKTTRATSKLDDILVSSYNQARHTALVFVVDNVAESV